MRDPRQFLFWVKIGLAGMGAIFLAIGVGVGISNVRFASNAKRADGVVVELVWSHSGKGGSSAAPMVRFEVDGKPFTFRGGVSSRPPSYDVGEKVRVLYDPEDPSNAKIDGFWELYLLPFIFTLLGGLELLAVGIWVAIDRRRMQRIERAFSEGRRVLARVEAIDLNRNVRVNRNHPWRITAVHSAATGPLRFVSDNLWSDPSGAYPVGSEVPVFYVPAEPSVYAFKLEKISGDS